MTYGGVLSGTPMQAGVYSGSVRVSNGTAPDALQNFVIVVVANPIQQYSILHHFTDGTTPGDGGGPFDAVVFGADGALYGTTIDTGVALGGTAFKITTQGALTVLHTFAVGNPNPYGPEGNLYLAADGNYYGTTNYGGAGSGTVFKMTPQGLVTTVHSFADGSVANDGAAPDGGVVQAPDGNFYGVSTHGRTTTNGTIYRVTPQGVVTILHNFTDGSVPNDGYWPHARMTVGPDGALYGITPVSQGTTGGIAFRITTLGAYTILHHFGDGTTPNDGGRPQAALLLGPDGNFYATTGSTVFRMTPAGAMTILHQFNDGSTYNDSAGSNASLVLGNDGNFYGTYDASGQGNGTIYQVTPQGAVTTLYKFGSIANDGVNPWAGLTLAGDGNLYGTTLWTGSSSGSYAGVVFKCTMGSQTPVFTSPANAIFYSGHANSFQVISSGTAPASYSATGLPSWASINSLTGVISGTPPDASGSPFTVTVSALNGMNASVQQVLTLAVSPLPSSPLIFGAPPPTQGLFGINYSFTYSATGTPAPTFSLTSGTLPPGLNVSSAGVLSGIPTQAGNFTGTITATNGTGPDAAQNFSITIQPPIPPTITSSQLTTRIATGTSFTYKFTAMGSPAPTISQTAGALPPGFTLGPDGTLSGTPTQAGTYTGTITATDGGAPDATQSFSITVVANPLLQYQVIHTFTTSIAGGTLPQSPLIAGPSGIFYGTTANSTPSITAGSLLSITQEGVTNVLHAFGPTSGPDGSGAKGIVRGTDGNIYGVTSYGGSAGNGAVFMSTPQGAVTLLHSFGDGTIANDGQNPQGGLTLGTDGNFYGVTYQGGSNGQGTIFKITAAGVTMILHSFPDSTVPGGDGSNPQAALIQAKDGAFYGTASLPGGGLVFKITSAGLYSVVGRINSPSVAWPILQGLDGNFLGSMTSGSTGKGAIFKMTPQGTTTTLHTFGDGTVANDGAKPTAPLILGTDNNYYGVTALGGAFNKGTIFQMTQAGAVTVLYSFGTVSNDGASPTEALIEGPDGNLYGTAGVSLSTNVIFKATLNLPLPVAPVFLNNPLSVSTAVNSPYSFTYSTSGYPAPSFTVSVGQLPLGLNISASGVISGTPTAPGDFTGTVKASNGTNPDATQAFQILVTDTYSAWITREGLTGASAAQTAVLQPDGMSNLMKYALGLIPTHNYNPGGYGDPDGYGIPTVKLANYSGPEYLTMTFDVVATDVTFNVQATSNLSDSASWTTIQTFSGQGAVGSHTVKDTQPLSSTPARYMRLQVTSP